MRAFIRAGVPYCFGGVLLLALAGCSESPQGFIKKENVALNQTLDSLEAIAAEAPEQTLGAERIALPADSPAIDMDDIGSYSIEGRANAQLFTVQDLTDPEEQSPGLHLFPALKTWQAVKVMVKDGLIDDTQGDAVPKLQHFANWRYAVVLKVQTVQAPQISSPPVSTNVTETTTYSSGTFAGGAMKGETLIYDLKDASFLGGFAFAAESSQRVESTSYGGEEEGGLQRQMDRDFTEQIKQAVFKGLLKRLPSGRVYMSGNLRQRVLNEKGK